MYKKILIILLVSFLVLPIFGKTSFIFAEEESKACVVNGVEFSEEECTEMFTNARKKVAEIEKAIADAEGKQQEMIELASKYSLEAQSMQDEIDELSIKINQLQERIDELIVQIEENEALVEALNGRVKDRMVAYQKTMHFNGYLEFILGSKSFSDMLRRIYGVESVNSKDKEDREAYVEIITQLNSDKKELDESKQILDNDYQDLVSKQEELKAMQSYYEAMEAEIQAEIDELNNERDDYEETFNDLSSALKEAGISANYGFVAAVHNSWISSTVWNYSSDFLDGKWHLGVDYAASRYTEIHAPAGGVIIRADDSCGDPGYLGNGCGNWLSGGGNQVYLMAEVDGVVYGFIFFHMNTVYVSYGDIVSQDEVIGLVGSSGSSTGPHCHLEMYKLGNGSLEDFLAMGWSATFGCGRGREAYNNRCYYDGDRSYRQAAPCILNPEWYLPEA